MSYITVCLLCISPAVFQIIWSQVPSVICIYIPKAKNSAQRRMVLLGSSACGSSLKTLNPLPTPNSTSCLLRVKKHPWQPFTFISDLLEWLKKLVFCRHDPKHRRRMTKLLSSYFNVLERGRNILSMSLFQQWASVSVPYNLVSQMKIGPFGKFPLSHRTRHVLSNARWVS